MIESRHGFKLNVEFPHLLRGRILQLLDGNGDDLTATFPLAPVDDPKFYAKDQSEKQQHPLTLSKSTDLPTRVLQQPQGPETRWSAARDPRRRHQQHRVHP